MGEEILLTISILASNRKDTMKKCLDSLEPIRKALPCELIITDTGCDDELRRMLEEYADVVTDFTWCKDFAKARNVGLSMARGRWFLFLDDDEWFVETQDIIDFFKKGYFKQFDHAYYLVRNFFDLQGNQYADSHVLRILKIDPEMHFEGKIHEYLVPEKRKGLALNSMVYHYGYAFKSEEDRIAHYKRNCIALEEMVQEEPENLHWWTHLAKEYNTGKEYGKLFDTAEKGLAIACGRDDAKKEISAFYASKIVALNAQERYEEELQECLCAYKDSRIVQIGRAFLDLELADLLVHKEQYKEAAEYISDYWKIHQFFQKNDAKFVVQRTIAFAGKSYEPVQQKKAYSIGIICDLKRGQTTELSKHLNDLGWKEKAAYLYDRILLETIAEAMVSIHADEVFVRTIKELHYNEGLWNEFCSSVITHGLPEGEKSVVRVEKLFGRAGFGTEIKALLNYKRAEGHIVQNQFGPEFSSAWQCFLDYSVNCIRYYECRYGKKYLEDHIERLPLPCIAALLIREAMQAKESSEEQFITSLKQCASVYKIFENPIRRLFCLYEEEKKQQKICAGEELQNLKKQVIEQIQMLVSQGKQTEAMELVKQLKTIVGNDLDVAELAVKIQIQGLQEKIRTEENTNTKKVVAMAPYDRPWGNVELVKDCGLIPYLLSKNHGFEAVMVGAKGNVDYTYKQLVDGLRMEFLKDGTVESKVDYIRHHALEIDLLLLRGWYRANWEVAKAYKYYNPDGKIYIGLDANSIWTDRVDWKNKDFAEYIESGDVVAASGREICSYLNRKWPWKISDIPNGYYDFTKSRPKPDFSKKSNTILTVGRLGTEQKGTPIMLEAFALAASEIPDWNMRLVGTIEQSFHSYIDSYFERYPHLVSRVTFAGEIKNREELFQEYLDAKIFTLSSRLEGGTPNVVAEALHAGCVMAMTRFDGAMDITDWEKCGRTAEIDNTEQLADIYIVLANDKRLRALSEYAYDHGKRNFDMKRITAKLYGQLYGRNNG